MRRATCSGELNRIAPREAAHLLEQPVCIQPKCCGKVSDVHAALRVIGLGVCIPAPSAVYATNSLACCPVIYGSSWLLCRRDRSCRMWSSHRLAHGRVISRPQSASTGAVTVTVHSVIRSAWKYSFFCKTFDCGPGTDKSTTCRGPDLPCAKNTTDSQLRRLSVGLPRRRVAGVREPRRPKTCASSNGVGCRVTERMRRA